MVSDPPTHHHLEVVHSFVIRWCYIPFDDVISFKS